MLAIHNLETELLEHVNKVHSIKDLVVAQNGDVYILPSKIIVRHENNNQDFFPEDVRALARNYFK